jgi:hypothetical protein
MELVSIDVVLSEDILEESVDIVVESVDVVVSDSLLQDTKKAADEKAIKGKKIFFINCF